MGQAGSFLCSSGQSGSMYSIMVRGVNRGHSLEILAVTFVFLGVTNSSFLSNENYIIFYLIKLSPESLLHDCVYLCLAVPFHSILFHSSPLCRRSTPISVRQSLARRITLKFPREL